MSRFNTSIAQYNSDKFTHDKKAKSLTAEASELRLSCFSMLYWDALDSGLALFNPKTGSVTYWYVEDIIYDPSGEDIQGWELKPVSSQLARIPQLEGYTMTIYND